MMEIMERGNGNTSPTFSNDRNPSALDEFERLVFSVRALKRLHPREDFSRRFYPPSIDEKTFPEGYLPDFFENQDYERARFREAAERVSSILETDEESAYAERIIRKKWKDRVIHSPDGPGIIDATGRNLLREVQSHVQTLISCAPLPEYVAGFRKDQSPYSTLRSVLDGFASIEACLSIDVRNFFPSVSEAMVRSETSRLLSDFGLKENRSEIVWIIAKISTFRGNLVQGAPTSPTLANLAAHSRIDKKLRPLLADLPSRSATYFRYADDIIVLSNQPLTRRFRERFMEAARETGFEIAEEKTEYRERSEFYPILGVDVIWNGNGWPFFRLPKRKARKWAKEILETCDLPDIPSETSEFLRDKRMSRIFALLGHAAHVNRIGENEKSKDPIRGELRHAWNVFRKRFSGLLPKRSTGWFGPKCGE